MTLTRSELARYSRQIALPELGAEGQEKLKASSVLVVGAGGLGSPVSLYLAAAGVGRIGLVEFDTVDVSDLHRQLLHGWNDIGRHKLESAAERLGEVNPALIVDRHEVMLSADNAFDIIGAYGLVIDGSDNFPTRYLVNDACVLLKKPNVYGSVFRFEGQASVFDAERGPCYRCLYPEPPPPELVPSCEEGGVLGVVPGIIGLVQATEAMKILTGIGGALIGRLLLFDALKMQFRELKLRKDEHCRVCGANPTITELIDYEGFCRVRPSGGATEISVRDLYRRLTGGEELTLLDVREPFEWEIADFGRAQHIPLRALPSRIEELDRTTQIVVYCHVGARSAYAADFLRQAGFSNVVNLGGGIDAWAAEIEPAMPRY